MKLKRQRQQPLYALTACTDASRSGSEICRTRKLCTCRHIRPVYTTVIVTAPTTVFHRVSPCSTAATSLSQVDAHHRRRMIVHIAHWPRNGARLAPLIDLAAVPSATGQSVCSLGPFALTCRSAFCHVAVRITLFAENKRKNPILNAERIPGCNAHTFPNPCHTVHDNRDIVAI